MKKKKRKSNTKPRTSQSPVAKGIVSSVKENGVIGVVAAPDSLKKGDIKLVADIFKEVKNQKMYDVKIDLFFDRNGDEIPTRWIYNLILAHPEILCHLSSLGVSAEFLFDVLREKCNEITDGNNILRSVLRRICEYLVESGKTYMEALETIIVSIATLSDAEYDVHNVELPIITDANITANMVIALYDYCYFGFKGWMTLKPPTGDNLLVNWDDETNTLRVLRESK